MKVPALRGIAVSGAALACAAAVGCGSNPTSTESSDSSALDVKARLTFSWGAESEPLRPLPATSQSPTAPASGTPIVATDGDVPTDQGRLWVIEPRGGRARITGIVLAAHRATAVLSRSVATVPLVPTVPTVAPGVTSTAPQANPSAYDVARWDPAVNQTDLFTFTPGSRGVGIRVLSFVGTPRTLFQGTIPVPPPLKGAHRDFAVATWEGSRPDAFVIDRGLPNERVRILIYSGESGFRRQLASVSMPFRKARAKDWSVDVGRVNQPRPDLLFFAHTRRRSHLEVHVAAGEQNFQRFFYEKQLDLRYRQPSTYHYAFGVWQGAESFLGVNLPLPGSGSVQIVPFVQRAKVL